MFYFLSIQYNVSINPNFSWHTTETLYLYVFCHLISEAAALYGEKCWLFNVCLETPVHCSFSNVSKGGTADILEGLRFQRWLTGKKRLLSLKQLCAREKKTQASHQLHGMRTGKRGLWTVKRHRRAAVSQVNSFQLQEWNPPNWISLCLSRQPMVTKRVDMPPTVGHRQAAKETPTEPSKCLPCYIGAEVVPGKHLLTSVSLLRESQWAWQPKAPCW